MGCGGTVRRAYLTTDVPILGLSGLTLSVRVRGRMTRSRSSMGMEPRRTSSLRIRAPAKPTRFLKRSSTQSVA